MCHFVDRLLINRHNGIGAHMNEIENERERKIFASLNEIFMID